MYISSLSCYTDKMKSKYLLVICLLLFGFFFVSILVVLGVFQSIDRYVDQTLPYSQTSILYLLSRIIANLYFPLLVGLFILFFLFRHMKEKIESWMLLLSFSGWGITELILKPLFHIRCPNTYYMNIQHHQELFQIPWIQKIAMKDTCYPSGHTASYVVFFGYLLFLSLVYIKNKKVKTLSVTILSLIILLVGPSRIYLHVHWLSDVIAAYFLGFAILLALIVLRQTLLSRNNIPIKSK